MHSKSVMTSPACFSASACDDDHEFQRERTLVDCIIFQREYGTAFDIRERKVIVPEGRLVIVFS
jgi:hypothetical protein